MRMIDLDANATTPMAPAVQEAMLPFLAEHYGHPSSPHPLGRAAREAIEDARTRIAQAIGAESGEIVFTSGGTESNNLAVQGVCLAALLGTAAERAPRPAAGRAPRHLVVTALEHASVLAPARFVEHLGFEVTVVPGNAQGVVDPSAVAAALRPHTALVSVIHASGETGAILPVREIASLCRQRGVRVHCDAAQSFGRIAARVDDLSVDLLTLTGHKFHGPKGCGALYVRRGTALRPLIDGGPQEARRRAGTENTAAIVGLGQAAALVTIDLDDASARLATLRERLLAALRDSLGDQLAVNAADAPRLPNTLSLRMAGVSGAAILERAGEICASTGAPLDGARRDGSAALLALGLSADQVRETIRLAVGRHTTEADVDRAANLLVEAWEALYKSPNRR